MARLKFLPFLVSGILSTGIGFVPIEAWAQNAIEITPSLPGYIIDSSRQPGATHHEAPVSPEARPEPEIEGLTPPEPEAPGITQPFPVSQIRVEGVSKINRDQVRQIVAEYEGREISFVELRELASRLTQLYRDQGYATTLVYIPPQRIENGVVVLRAAEGIVGEVNYEPEPFYPKRTILPRISLREGSPFNTDTLRRQLRRINENPDLNVRATLLAGDEPNETDINLSAETRFPAHITLFWDNLGRPIIGRQRGGVTTTHNNLLGFGDRAFNTVAWSRRSFSTVSHYEMPIGAHGTRFNFDHAFSTLKLGGDLEPLDVRGKARIFSSYISQELVNTEKSKIIAELGFDFKNTHTDILGTRFSEDRLRVLRPALTFDYFDRFGRTVLRHEMGIGLDVLGGTTGDEIQASRTGAGTKFLRYTGSLTRIQRLPLNTYAIFRAMGQATPDRLVSIEQFQLGGAYTLRGYLEGELIGDAGYLFSAEWRTPLFIVPSTWRIPHTNYHLRQNIQLAAFGDFGGVFVNRPAAGIPRSQYGLGVGAGVRFNLTRFLAGRVDVGIPLLRENLPGQQQVRMHFGLESRLF